MKYRYVTCDVFTDQRFGGNPLAVLPDAKGLSTDQMQNIAKEFNYAETSFVLPGGKGFDRQVRIFTPEREIPFAGHPNIGTAFVLAYLEEFSFENNAAELVFDELAGPVSISLEKNADVIICELKAPQKLEVGATIAKELVASALSLDTSDIKCVNHNPVVASVGFPFLIVELANLDALQRAKIYLPAFDDIRNQGVSPQIYFYVVLDEAENIQARMFAPKQGIPEDPATGSAAAALAALLSHIRGSEGVVQYCISQGAEMKRPSNIGARTQMTNGDLQGIFVRGRCQIVCDGLIRV